MGRFLFLPIKLKQADSLVKDQAVAASWIADVMVLFKSRLALLVVFSAVLGYLMGATQVDWIQLISLSLGGFLLTGGSGGLNQVWERHADAKMSRTVNRPLPGGRMRFWEAITISSVAAGSGILILWLGVNTISGVLGLLAFFSYVFIYTPLKPFTSLAVFVGAFPGAIPPMLGYVAATGVFGVEPGILFAVQFFWQFPHFWAIAWVADEDYRKAGFSLLPFAEGRSKRSSYQILLYSLFLIPVGMLAWALPPEPMIGSVALVVSILCGIGMSWAAWRLHKSNEIADARVLMFASFAYLPLVQLIYVIDKVQ